MKNSTEGKTAYFIKAGLEKTCVQTTENDDEVLILVHRRLFGRDVYHAVPKKLFDSNKWTMFDGSFVYTSDSRFGEHIGNRGNYPIAVHDRVENH